MDEFDEITSEIRDPDIPRGEFWTLMYDEEVLSRICSVRAALNEACDTPERIALRGIMLGALHGPLRVDGSSSYFSNQFPRTFASKPDYSVKYWKTHNLIHPPKVDVRNIIKTRANRYYSGNLCPVKGFITKGDSTERSTFEEIESRCHGALFDTVITSPPYHGINTYIPDQWLRNWFVGGPSNVEYTKRGQTSGGLGTFIDQLKKVWVNCERICSPGSNMFIRFGEIANKDYDPEDIIERTFDGTGWHIDSINGAGEPKKGRRSSETFLKTDLNAYREIDVHAKLYLK